MRLGCIGSFNGGGGGEWIKDTPLESSSYEVDLDDNDGDNSYMVDQKDA